MKATKITDADTVGKRVADLPTRPTAPAAFGGSGYTARELKAAFDALPGLIIERYNQLIDDIFGTDGESVTDAVPTGISEGHTLADMLADIKSGAFVGYLAVSDGTVAEYLAKLREDIDKLASALKITL